MVKPQIKLLESPSHRCVELVYEELMKICHNCGSPELSRYPKLQQKLIEVISDLLRERLGPTISYVESLIEIHRSYINTNHPSFVGAAAAMASVVEDRQKQKEQEKNAKLLEQNKSLKPKLLQSDINGSTKDLDEDYESGESDSASDVGSQSSHARHNSNNKNESKDSFLNFFFGKEQQHQNQQQQQNGSKFVNGHSRQPSKLAKAFEDMQINNNNTNNNISNSHPYDSELTLDEEEPILSEREQLECELIKRLITSYFGIVREMIQDQVPKAIMCLLVNYSKESVQNRLVSKLYKDSLFEELLLEDADMAQEREKCSRLLETYREASKIISDVL